MSICIILFGIKFIRKTISGLGFFLFYYFWFYVTALVVLTFFPFPYQKFLIETMIEDHLGLEHDFIPFKGIIDGIHYGYFIGQFKQYVLNILLFVPLGFALPVFLPNLKYKKVILIGCLVSLTIEILQAIAGIIVGYTYRAADIDNLMMNTLGTIIGLIVFRFLYIYLQKNKLLLNK